MGTGIEAFFFCSVFFLMCNLAKILDYLSCIKLVLKYNFVLLLDLSHGYAKDLNFRDASEIFYNTKILLRGG